MSNSSSNGNGGGIYLVLAAIVGGVFALAGIWLEKRLNDSPFIAQATPTIVSEPV